MSIWFTAPDVGAVNAMSRHTLAEVIGISFTDVGDDCLTATMPVDRRTRQPMGILHGGASVALSETIASVGAYLSVDPSVYACVGLEINANHVRAIREGTVTGVGRPLHLGRSTQIWEVRISDADNRLICISRVTMAVLAHSEKSS